MLKKLLNLKTLETKKSLRYIGFSAEATPLKKVTLICLSSLMTTFMIDMVALKNSKKLDRVLCRLFSSRKIVILAAVGLTRDFLWQIESFPKMLFHLKIANYVDIKVHYEKVYKRQSLTMAMMIKELLATNFCEGEK